MADVPLDELIRRYEAGDRDPDLIRLLNEAAWDGFHDPWEHPKPSLLAAAPEAPFDPEALRPFTAETVQRFLDGGNYTYWTSTWDSFLLFWRYSVDSDRVVRAIFMVEGKHKTVFKLRIVGDRRVPRERFDVARQLCNAWNEGYRWPRAYLEKPDLKAEEVKALDGKEPASAILALDFQLYLPAGVPQVLFDRQVRDVLATSWEFWELALKDYDL